MKCLNLCKAFSMKKIIIVELKHYIFHCHCVSINTHLQLYHIAKAHLAGTGTRVGLCVEQSVHGMPNGQWTADTVVNTHCDNVTVTMSVILIAPFSNCHDLRAHFVVKNKIIKMVPKTKYCSSYSINLLR